MGQWGPIFAGAALAALGWAAAFGMLRAQVQGLRRDIERLIADSGRTEEKLERVATRISVLVADVAVLAALANAAEQLRRVERELS